MSSSICWPARISLGAHKMICRDIRALTAEPAKGVRAFTPVFAGYAVNALMLFAGYARNDPGWAP